MEGARKAAVKKFGVADTTGEVGGRIGLVVFSRVFMFYTNKIELLPAESDAPGSFWKVLPALFWYKYVISRFSTTKLD